MAARFGRLAFVRLFDRFFFGRSLPGKAAVAPAGCA
jgi:hypothetical protein